MKKFETPIINISVFDAENVVTASNPEPGQKDAVTAANTFLNNEQVTNIFEFTF